MFRVGLQRHVKNQQRKRIFSVLVADLVFLDESTLQSVLINSQNEETCISERNLYRVETAVLSV
jgi:hypothetical protein